MSKLLFLALCVFSLSGCVTTLDAAGDYICDNADATRVGLEIAYARALQIEDESRRELALAGIEVSYAALEACEEDS